MEVNAISQAKPIKVPSLDEAVPVKGPVKGISIAAGVPDTKADNAGSKVPQLQGVKTPAGAISVPSLTGVGGALDLSA